MILTTAMLTDRLRGYGDPAGKILRMKAAGELIPLTRGLYETDPDVPGRRLAGAIFGPSYLSFDSVLSDCGLIPEAVYAYTSATFDKKKAKTVENRFGRFTYRDVPADAYPYGILLREEDGYIYRIARPEKALCDKLYTMPPTAGRKELEKMLFEDLRVDRTGFERLNAGDLIFLAEKYRCANLKHLVGFLRRRSK